MTQEIIIKTPIGLSLPVVVSKTTYGAFQKVLHSQNKVF